MMLSLLLGAATALSLQQPRLAGPSPDTLPPEPSVSVASTPASAPVASAAAPAPATSGVSAPVPSPGPVMLAGEPQGGFIAAALPRVSPAAAPLHSTLLAPLWTAGAPALAGIDSIVVEKRLHRLTLFSHGVPMRSYLVALGQQPIGDKRFQGDNRTPEGLFHIEARNPQSQYYKALRISYPDSAHAARAAAVGRSPGGDIMIHGLPPAYAYVGARHREQDWTEGCIAVTDQEIDDIWRAVPVGTPIEIKP